MPEQDPPFLSGPDADLAQRLASLRLADPGTSQREIWYRAGVQAGRRRAGVWRGVATVASILAGGLLAWNVRPSAPPSERIVYVRAARNPGTVAAPQTIADSSDDYLRLQNALLRDGLRGLPASEPAGNGPPPDRPDRMDDFGPDPVSPLAGYPLNQRG